MKVIATDSLRLPEGGSARFEGVEHGVDVSFFVVNAAAGRGAAMHIHPYPEVFVILDGEVLVTTGDDQRTVGPSHVVVIPAGTWHAFSAVSEGPARMVNIHPSAMMIQDWAPVSGAQQRR